MNREQAAEDFEARRKIVAERILRNLERSRHHADLSPSTREWLADRLAWEAVGEPPAQVADEDLPSFPGIGPDGLFVEIGD